MVSKQNLPASLKMLLQRSETDLPSLRPTKPYRSDFQPIISQLTKSHPSPVVAMVHLLNDDLDAAHSLAQDDESNRDSNLIHSILHRREADYWNSKWWLNQFQHPFLDQLYSEREPKPRNGKEGAKQFVDAVERITTKGATTACGATRDVAAAKQWQWKELHDLAEYIFAEYHVAFENI